MVRTVTICAVLPLFLISSPVQADWIHGSFSDRAGIDSIERCTVLRDSEPDLLFGWLTLSLGDITGDGTSDIIVFRHEGSPFVANEAFLFHGGSDSLPDAVYANFLPWGNVVGDVDGDGYVDLAQYKPLPSRMELFFGGPDFDDSVDFTIANVFSEYAQAVDLDADGALDLPLSVSVNGGFVNIYRIDSLRDTIPEYVIPDTAKDFGRNLATGDFNGDTYADLAVAAYMNRDTSFVKFYWGGPAFDTVADFVIYHEGPRFGQHLVPLGDFNGDGYGDIFIGGTSNHQYGIYLGGPYIDDRLDALVNRDGSFHFAIYDADLAGDINNDGYPDVIVGQSVDMAYLFEIYVFLGGPVTDSVRSPDIYIEQGMIPGYQMYFGSEVAGIGDFTGDGIDDFAVRSQQVISPGVGECDVNIFAGYDPTATAVPYEYEPVLPADYQLSQNYPNPFNSSTAIEFALPRRGVVTLSIVNVLGERVQTLMDRDLPAGSYRVSWDGRDESGNPVASGVYLCHLQTTKFSQSRKMLLLK